MTLRSFFKGGSGITKGSFKPNKLKAKPEKYTWGSNTLGKEFPVSPCSQSIASWHRSDCPSWNQMKTSTFLIEVSHLFESHFTVLSPEELMSKDHLTICVRLPKLSFLHTLKPSCPVIVKPRQQSELIRKRAGIFAL